MMVLTGISIIIVFVLSVRWHHIHINKTYFETYLIEKGKHYSFLTSDPYRWLYKFVPTFKDTLRFEAMFGVNCQYDLKNSDQEDINKLYGITMSYSPLVCSARIGWKWNKSQERIDLYAYIHDGKNVTFRELEYLTSVKLGQSFVGLIFVRNERVQFVIQRKSKEVIVDQKSFIYRFKFYSSPWKLKFKNYPYFGGNRTAPHSMKIFIHESK